MLTGKVKVIRRFQTSSEDFGYDVISDEEGIVLEGQGLHLQNQEELAVFADVVGSAWQDHLKLHQRARDIARAKLSGKEISV